MSRSKGPQDRPNGLWSDLRRTISGLYGPDSTIHQKVLSGSLWSFGLRGGQQVLTLVRLVILARLLLPSDFGLLGIAVLTIFGLDVFSQTGLQQALIQKKEDIQDDLDAAWTLLIVRGIILFAVLFAFAPYIAGFFEAPEAVPVLRVIGLSLVFQGFTNLGTVHFLKDLDFKKQFLFQFTGDLADFAVAVGIVLVLDNVWALVLGYVAKDLTTMLVSYYIHPYRPRLKLDLRRVRRLSNFGMWIFFSSILLFLLTQGDDVLVGRILGAAALGFYQMAYGFSNAPTTEISQVLAQVAFPAYSSLQDDREKLRDVFVRMFKVTTLLTFPLAGFLFALAPDFTMALLGPTWEPIVPIIQVLAWWGLMRGLNTIMGAVFMAIGRPRTLSVLQFIQTVMMFTALFPLLAIAGVLGASVAVLITAIPVFILMCAAVVRTLRLDGPVFFRLMAVPMAMTLAGVMPVVVVRLVLDPAPGLLSFLLLLGLYVLMVLGISVAIDRYTRFKIWGMVGDGSLLAEARRTGGPPGSS